MSSDIFWAQLRARIREEAGKKRADDTLEWLLPWADGIKWGAGKKEKHND